MSFFIGKKLTYIQEIILISKVLLKVNSKLNQKFLKLISNFQKLKN